MQQRHSNTSRDEEVDENNSKTLSKNYRNSKLKVLIRSHAMREEQSPPREANHPLSPVVNVTASPQNNSPVKYPAPLVVLSPSISPEGSPTRSPAICSSPTSTLVPSPNAVCTPQTLSPQDDKIRENFSVESSPTQVSYVSSSKKKHICDCTAQECNKCGGKVERNINNNVAMNVNNNVNNLMVNRINSRGKLKQQSSSQSSFESGITASPCLSRDNSSEQYTDTTGVDLEIFIPETLNRNAKDRALMLRIEQELVSLAKDKSKTHYKFPPMSSYQRMLVHRCAAYFGMEHNIESSGKCVVVNKCRSTRIPEVPFKEHVKEDLIFSEEPRRSILKRDSNSIDDEYFYKSPDRQYGENRRSKSFEEREEEYEKARRRIFHKEVHDSSSVEDFTWSEVPWSSTDSEASSRYRLQLPDSQRKNGKLFKVHSEEVNDTLRPQVAKSFSFGGYGGGVSILNRGDSVMSTHSAGARLLTKQDSAASSISWRLSPSSSGYKSQSQMSESVTPSPTSTPHPGSKKRDACNDIVGDSPLVWAVTNIESVPKGSVIINPQNGQPLKNPDGSLYHYDPENPPAGFKCVTKSPSPPPKVPTTPPPLKDQTQSPKKKSAKNSPVQKLNVTNSSTSPSYPYSPSMGASKAFSFPNASVESPQVVPGMYNSSFATSQPIPEATVPMYQPSCILYGSPYGVPMQQHVVEQQSVTDVGANYYINLPDNPCAVPSTQIIYQQAPNYWPQQSVYSPQQLGTNRFPVALQPQAGCLSGYPTTNFTPSTTQIPQTSDFMGVYSAQQVQYMYQNPSSQTVLYPAGQGTVLYNQNYSTTYPPSTPTPNSSSQISNSYSSRIVSASPPAFHNITQGIAHLNVTNPLPQPQLNYYGQKASERHKNVGTLKNMPQQSRFGIPKGGFLLNSSQSSTGTNSPAATVVCAGPQAGMYRTPPETPPTPCGFGGMNMVFKQVGGFCSNRTSRSPTPNEACLYDRQRIPIQQAIYHGLPYVIQPDSRIATGRGQPTAYRQPTPPRQQPLLQSADMRNQSHRNVRKAKGYKTSAAGLPPSGKQG